MVKNECNECGYDMNAGDDIYCYDCHDGVLKELEDAKMRINELEDELNELKSDEEVPL